MSNQMTPIALNNCYASNEWPLLIGLLNLFLWILPKEYVDKVETKSISHEYVKEDIFNKSNKSRKTKVTTTTKRWLRWFSQTPTIPLVRVYGGGWVFHLLKVRNSLNWEFPINDCVWSTYSLISEMLIWHLAIEEYKPKVLHYSVFIRFNLFIYQKF